MEQGEEKQKKTAKAEKIEWKIFLWLGALVIAWFAYIALSAIIAQPQQAQSSESITVIVKAINADGTTVLDKTVSIEKGQSVFDATKKADPTLGYSTDPSFGAMINSISGVSPGQNWFWALYVNGKIAQTGASSTMLNENALVEWKIESAESYNR